MLFCSHVHRVRPHNRLDPRQVGEHTRENGRTVDGAARLTERSYTDQLAQARLVGVAVVRLQRAA